MTGQLADVEGLGVDTFWVNTFPDRVSFALLLTIKGLEDDFATSTAHGFQVSLIGPGPQLLHDLSFSFVGTGVSADHQPGWEVTRRLPLHVRFTAEAPGTHGIEIWLNGRYQRASPFFTVRQGTPPPVI